MVTSSKPAVVVVEAPAVEHFRGCPVEQDPGNPELASRVERWWAVKDGMALDETKKDRQKGGRIQVVHCCECGAMTHHEE